MKEPLRYRDCLVSPGCNLYQALEEKKPALANKLYWESETEYLKYNGTPEQQVRAAKELKKILDKEKADAARKVSGGNQPA